MHDERENQAHKLHQAGHTATARGDHATARSLLRQSLALSAPLGDHTARLDPLYLLATVESTTGDPAEAQRLLTECITLADRLGDPRRRAIAQGALGSLLFLQGDHPAGHAAATEALATLRALDAARDAAADLRAASAEHTAAPTAAADTPSRQTAPDAPADRLALEHLLFRMTTLTQDPARPAEIDLDLDHALTDLCAGRHRDADTRAAALEIAAHATGDLRTSALAGTIRTHALLALGAQQPTFDYFDAVIDRLHALDDPAAAHALRATVDRARRALSPAVQAVGDALGAHRTEEAIALADAALADAPLAPPRTDRETLQLLLWRAQAHTADEAFDAAVADYARAHALACHLGDPGLDAPTEALRTRARRGADRLALLRAPVSEILARPQPPATRALELARKADFHTGNRELHLAGLAADAALTLLPVVTEPRDRMAIWLTAIRVRIRAGDLTAAAALLADARALAHRAPYARGVLELMARDLAEAIAAQARR